MEKVNFPHDMAVFNRNIVSFTLVVDSAVLPFSCLGILSPKLEQAERCVSREQGLLETGSYNVGSVQCSESSFSYIPVEVWTHDSAVVFLW